MPTAPPNTICVGDTCAPARRHTSREGNCLPAGRGHRLPPRRGNRLPAVGYPAAPPAGTTGDAAAGRSACEVRAGRSACEVRIVLPGLHPGSGPGLIDFVRPPSPGRWARPWPQPTGSGLIEQEDNGQWIVRSPAEGQGTWSQKTWERGVSRPSAIAPGLAPGPSQLPQPRLPPWASCRCCGGPYSMRKLQQNNKQYMQHAIRMATSCCFPFDLLASALPRCVQKRGPAHCACCLCRL